MFPSACRFQYWLKGDHEHAVTESFITPVSIAAASAAVASPGTLTAFAAACSPYAA